MSYRQARWIEPLIFEKSRPGVIGYMPPSPDLKEREIVGDPYDFLPSGMRRRRPPALPELSEGEVVRHYIRLSQQSFGVDSGAYPLGSCTMKYNPKVCDEIVCSPKIRDLHPLQDESLTQGILEVLYHLSNLLAEVTGMSRFSLQPAAGAHAEFTGALIIRAYHKVNGEGGKRDEMLIPDSAHGTNPASAAMAGFKTVTIPTEDSGCIDVDAVESAVNEHTAGLMLTNPNTLGIFEREILEVSETIHSAGGLLYYDGANMNAILGKTRPLEMGFDIVHLNLHKTFATPHGGGGPGAGPVGVVKRLEEYLPVPLVAYDGSRYYLDYDRPLSVGKIRGFYGNIAVLLRAYAYIISMGVEGLEAASELAVLNANYVARKLHRNGSYIIPFYPDSLVKHECVVSAGKIYRETGVRAWDISKRLLDYGIHSPTTYFPQIVDEALMIEPTETESLESLDRLVEAMIKVAGEAYSNPDLVKGAPYSTSVRRVDEAKASHPQTMCLSWRMKRTADQTSRRP
ncbi:aminomethyl-transferring glycine dehydrogenase subunit GcvPB [Candidatus Bathyarchaeota archaeon]|nr:aminomethyl-transferring glycine dehydrogenase subunit GcvPB [Candidatus Bathyarchaeota archaeon]